MSGNNLSWNSEKKNEKLTKGFLFIVNPFITFIYSLFSLKTKSSYVILFLFFIIYGFCFSVGTDKDLYSIDATSVRDNFEEMVSTSPSNFIESLKDYFSFDITSYKDIFAPTMVVVTIYQQLPLPLYDLCGFVWPNYD